MKRLTLKEGLARGFHPTYDVLAQGEWKWTGDGWELQDDERVDELLRQTLGRALKHHGY